MQTDYGTSEVEDMIWEVDEDCDGMIDWENFVQVIALLPALLALLPALPAPSKV